MDINNKNQLTFYGMAPVPGGNGTLIPKDQ